jgi:hypothetical protein
MSPTDATEPLGVPGLEGREDGAMFGSHGCHVSGQRAANADIALYGFAQRKHHPKQSWSAGDLEDPSVESLIRGSKVSQVPLIDGFHLGQEGGEFRDVLWSPAGCSKLSCVLLEPLADIEDLGHVGSV